jgi:hypothetical protein
MIITNTLFSFSYDPLGYVTNKLDCSIATKQKVEEHAEGERECGERKRAVREEREKEKETAE